MGKGADGDICRSIPASGVRANYPGRSRRRITASHCLSQPQGVSHLSLPRCCSTDNVQLLRDVGLDFTFLLSSALQPDPSSTAPVHPIFQTSAIAGTPAPGYHIEPCPFPGFQAEDEAESYFPHAIGTVPRAPAVAVPPPTDMSVFPSMPAARAAPETPLSGTTAPLSFQPRSPRKDNAAEFSLSGFSFGAPVASPGSAPASARRPTARPGLDPMGRRDSGADDDSLR